jgi:two-component system, LuxR family, response regulator FixJ
MQIKDQTIYIIDDETEVRDALRWLFESVHYQVKTYENAHEFLEEEPLSQAGCIIVDVCMPGMSGLELLEYLTFKKSQLPMLIITGYGDIEMAVRAMKAGAKDFILKPFNDQNLLEIVQNCLSDATIPQSLQIIRERVQLLSEREHQILDKILNGKLSKEIAYELSISLSTVETHRANIMNKMEAKNLAHLIKMYLQVQFHNEFS